MIFSFRIQLAANASPEHAHPSKKKISSNAKRVNAIGSKHRVVAAKLAALLFFLWLGPTSPSFAWTNISMRFETQQGKINSIHCRFNNAIQDIDGPIEIAPQLPGYQGFYLESVAPDHSFATLRRLLTGMTCRWTTPNPANAKPRRDNVWHSPFPHQQVVDLKNLIPANVIDDLLIDRPPTQHKALKLLVYFFYDRITVKWDTESWTTRPLPAEIRPALPQR